MGIIRKGRCLKVSTGKFILYVGLSVFVMLFYVVVNGGRSEESEKEILKLERENHIKNHESVVNSYFGKRKLLQTTNLGSTLFKNHESGFPQANKTFVVLIWKYFGWLQRRHIQGFHSNRSDPLLGCSVNNCQFSGDNQLLTTADAVVVHLQRGTLPARESRNQQQRWIFLTDEAPPNTFSLSKERVNLEDMDGLFNWSMSYRTSSDVPVPYGRVVPRQPVPIRYPDDKLIDLIPYWSKKRFDPVIAILMSNCKKDRMAYLKELQTNIEVHVHGSCSDVQERKESCPGHFQSDCEPMEYYLFYLVLENSQCKEYLTEKSFYHAYSKGAIPIISGPTKEDCDMLLPPHSYLHLGDYSTPKELADDVRRIINDEDTLLSYHRWRFHFEVLNEHGYFGSMSCHYCRVCEALNFNSVKEKVYDLAMLKSFLDPKLSCYLGDQASVRT